MPEKFIRTIYRIMAVQILYLVDFKKIDIDNTHLVKEAFNEVISNYEPGLYDDNGKKFISNLIEKALSSISDIGVLISSHLTKHKNVEQLNIMLKSILRCGVCELMHFNTPRNVVVSEYVSIARDFLSLNEVNFTNAILDKIAENLSKGCT